MLSSIVSSMGPPINISLEPWHAEDGDRNPTQQHVAAAELVANVWAVRTHVLRCALNFYQLRSNEHVLRVEGSQLPRQNIYCLIPISFLLRWVFGWIVFTAHLEIRPSGSLEFGSHFLFTCQQASHSKRILAPIHPASKTLLHAGRTIMLCPSCIIVIMTYLG